MPQQINLDEINFFDKIYRYHYPKADLEPLRRSIKLHGIQTPILLESTQTDYRIINGFQRLEIAQKMDIEMIPAIVSVKSPLENLKWSLVDNRVQDEFNLYEQAKALECAKDLGAGESVIIEEFLPLVGLHAHKNVYDEYRGFLRLPEPLIEFFTEKDIAISRTQTFQSLSKEGQRIAVELLETFSPGINVLDELLTNLYEISRRTDTPVPELYAELEIEQILEKAGQPHIALGQIRQRLQEYRYPVLSETNQQISNLVSELDLGDNVRINWDKRLENRGINVTFHWKTLQDVKESISPLQDTENQKLLEQLFDTI